MTSTTDIDRAPTIAIDVVIEDPAWAELINDLQSFIDTCHKQAANTVPALAGTAAILFADDATLKRLNGTFRGQPKPTNVLSFPSGEEAPEFLGDIAIARETCVREAEELKKPVRDHTAHVIVHGLLHLVGFDHETDQDANEMEKMEALIISKLGLVAPYKDDFEPSIGETRGRDMPKDAGQ